MSPAMNASSAYARWVGRIDLVLLIICRRRRHQATNSRALRHLPPAFGEARHHVVTKADTVDADTLEVVRLGSRRFSARVVSRSSTLSDRCVSALTGAGLEDLRTALAKVATEVPARNSAALARLRSTAFSQ